MVPPPSDLAARAVLANYGPAFCGVRLVPRGNAGGFSGARLWRVEGAGGPYCLRAWPPGRVPAGRLEGIHRLMIAARKKGLAFVPAVRATPGGATWVEHAGRLWDLTDWLPGRADFHDRPSLARLEAACAALALLHAAWSDAAAGLGPCPAVRRRLDCCRDWLALVDSGWRPGFGSPGADPVHPWAERAWRLLQDRVHHVPARLGPWADQSFPLQPCLCDVWHDHVLFEGDLVTGIVDYGGVKVDHVTVDLARLLGSLVGDDAGLRAAGLTAYARHRPLTEREKALVRVLDETGTLLGAANWLMWLYRDGKPFEDRGAVAARLADVVRRVEGWPG